MTGVGRDARHASAARDERTHGDRRQTEAVTRARTMPLAPVLDAVCLSLFVGLGRESHGIGRGVGWFFTVLWPFALGWFAVALAVGLYSARTRVWSRLAATWIAGIGIGLILRAVFTHRASLSTFAVVVYVFVGVFTFGWRAVALALRRSRVLTRS